MTDFARPRLPVVAAGREDHAPRLDAHQLRRFQIRQNHQASAHQRLRLVALPDAGDDRSGLSASLHLQLQQLGGLRHPLGRHHRGDTQVDFHEVVDRDGKGQQGTRQDGRCQQRERDPAQDLALIGSQVGGGLERRGVELAQSGADGQQRERDAERRVGDDQARLAQRDADRPETEHVQHHRDARVPGAAEDAGRDRLRAIEHLEDTGADFAHGPALAVFKVPSRELPKSRAAPLVPTGAWRDSPHR